MAEREQASRLPSWQGERRGGFEDALPGFFTTRAPVTPPGTLLSRRPARLRARAGKLDYSPHGEVLLILVFISLSVSSGVRRSASRARLSEAAM